MKRNFLQVSSCTYYYVMNHNFKINKKLRLVVIMLIFNNIIGKI